MEGLAPKIVHEAASESKERLIIDKVYQLTHPGFDAAWYGNGETGRKHELLEGLWIEKIKQIKDEPKSILFYVSMFSIADFRKQARKRAGKPPKNIWEAQEMNIAGEAIEKDLQRIFFATGELGKRFILLLPQRNGFTSVPNEQRRLKKILIPRGIEIPTNITINCFGEYLDQCVDTEAGHLARMLGVQIEELGKRAYRTQIKELSLSAEDPESFVYKKNSK